MNLAKFTLVLGGASSGKSEYAENLLGDRAVYIATALAADGEMAAKIARHKERRQYKKWTTIEEPIEIARVMLMQDQPVIIECLTIWLANLMASDIDIDEQIEELIAVIPAIKNPIVMVSNELGLGLVPENPIAREFRDFSGRLNQRLATVADKVVLVAAGLPLALKG